MIDVNYEGDYVDVYVEDKETVLNYSSNGHALLNVEGSFVESVIINEGVKSIGDKAFANCFYLKSITIPSSVTWIEPSA